MTQEIPDLASIQATTEGLFAATLGVIFTEAIPERIVAELSISRDMCTQPGTLHGGAIMAFADTLGAYGTALNLPEGAGTTTIESKTNFFARGIEGEKVIGECTPLHRGKRTMVWQTRVSRTDGILVALISQTQIVLAAQPTPGEQMAGLFQGLEIPEQKALLAELERAGAAMYRHWAGLAGDDTTREALLAAERREIENAEVLEGD